MTRTEARMIARIARRTARREWRRTTLIAALVAIPVLAAVTVAGVMRAQDVTPEQSAAGELGAAGLRVDLYAGAADGLSDADVAEVDELLADVGAEQVLAFRRGWLHGGGLEGIATLRLTDVTLDAPLSDGMYRVVDGRAPQASGEVALSPHVLSTTGHAVGDEIHLDGLGTLEVVGSVLDPLAARDALAALTPDDLRTLVADERTPWQPAWLVDGVEDPEAVSAQLHEEYQELVEPDVEATPELGRGASDGGQAAAQAGEPPPRTISVRTRGQILEGPPAGASTGVDRAMTPQVVATLVAAVLLAEVALIAGAAYATGARRRLRELGLLGANGATTTHVRGAVLGEAAVTGLFGGLVGVAGGIAVLHFGRGLLQPLVRPLITGLELSVSDLVGPVLAGVAAVTLAAWLPARTAAAVPTTTALQGRMPLATPKRWIVPVGLVLAAFGAVLFVVGVLAGGGGLAALVAGVGVLFAVGGTAMLTVPLVAVGGRIAHRLPATLRLVVRDSARQRTRAAAASASAMVVLMVPVLIATATLSNDTNQLVDGLPTADDHVLVARGETPASEAQPGPVAGTPQARAEAIEEIEERLPDATHADVAMLDQHVGVASSPRFSPLTEEQAASSPGMNMPYVGPEPGGSSSMGALAAVATPELVDALGSSAVAEAVGAGETVVLGIEERATTVTVDGRDHEAVELPVRVLRYGFPRVLVPPASVEEFGLEVTGEADLFVNPEPIDSATRQALYTRIGTTGTSVTVGYSPGLDGPLLRWLAVGGSMLVALVILALVTMLSATESDRDLRAMVAVGAAPRMRRRFLGLQTGLHALLGAALGTPLALALTWAALSANASTRVGPFGAVSTGQVWMDWPVVAAVVVCVPLLIAAAMALLVRSAPTAPPRRAA